MLSCYYHVVIACSSHFIQQDEKSQVLATSGWMEVVCHQQRDITVSSAFHGMTISSAFIVQTDKSHTLGLESNQVYHPNIYHVFIWDFQ